MKSDVSELEQALEASGPGVEASCVLLDYFPAGTVLYIDGRKTLICWERASCLSSSSRTRA